MPETVLEVKNLSKTLVESERLRLVPISPQYREDIFREFTDEITTYMIPPTPKDISETDAFVEKSQGEMVEGAGATFVITRKDTGEFIGCCGIKDVYTTTPEFGIWTKKSSHGNKYGREAVTALKKWADENLKYEYARYPVAKANVGSRKIAESLGGIVAREFIGKNGRGTPMEEVEYHIPQ
jgi:RimJ/RimL family protein N-acetyltransferase